MYLCYPVWRQPNILILFPLWVVTTLVGWVHQDTAINDSLSYTVSSQKRTLKGDTHMGHMDILLAKFLWQTLRQCPQHVLPRWECAGHNVLSNSCCGSCEDQWPSSLLLVNLIGLECLDNILRTCEHTSKVCLCHALDILWGDIKEWFPDIVCGIVEGDMDGLALSLGCWPSHPPPIPFLSIMHARSSFLSHSPAMPSDIPFHHSQLNSHCRCS